MTQAAVLAAQGSPGVSTGFRNRIINGGMTIDQRNAGASVTPTNGQYTLDRWQSLASQSGKYTVQQVTDAPTGYKNSLKVTSTSAYSVISTDRFMVRQLIEGNNFYDFALGTSSGSAIAVSFWVKSSLTGTFGGSFASDAGNAFYPFSYTISAANTWESITISIPTTALGTWSNDNTTSALLEFGFGVGSSRSGPANAWTTTSYDAPTGATSVVGTNGATFYITGVQLEAGTTATQFEFRDYGRELIMCQRYYQKMIGNIYYRNYSSANNTFSTPLTLPVTMRSAPTGTKFGTWGVINSGQPYCNGGGDGSIVQLGSTAGASNGDTAFYNSASASNYITLDIEL